MFHARRPAKLSFVLWLCDGAALGRTETLLFSKMPVKLRLSRKDYLFCESGPHTGVRPP